MTLTEFRGLVRTLLGGLTQKDEPDAVLDRFARDCLTAFASETDTDTEFQTMALEFLDGKRDYALPPYVSSIHRIELTDDNVSLEFVSQKELERDGDNYLGDTEGTPSQYSLIGRTLFVMPTPDSDTTATMVYSRAGMTLEYTNLDQLPDAVASYVAHGTARDYLLSKNPQDPRVAGLVMKMQERRPVVHRLIKLPVSTHQPRLKVTHWRQPTAR